jgi:glycosyltransferase involved in cell wall biosynthesis
MLSIIIPTKNEQRNILSLLNSLQKQNYKGAEVIVVDGGSTDGTEESVKQTSKKSKFPIRFIHETGTRSPANARNIGIRKSKGEYLFLIDADYEFIENNFLRKIEEALKHNDFTNVLTKPIIDSEMERQIAMTYPNISASCYRKSVFKKVLYDTNLGYGEDMLLWKKLGIDLNKTTDATIGRHYPHDMEEFKKQSYWYGKTLLPLLKKSIKEPALLLRNIPFIAGNLLAFPLFLIGILLILTKFGQFFLLGYLAYVLLRLVISPEMDLKRLRFLAWSSLYASFWYLAGFIKSLFKTNI